jgi:geranylgeranyl diphosphate synthase type II
LILDRFLEESRGWVDAALQRWLPPASEEPRRLHEAMRYTVFAGGKRLRPAIARAACRACGGADAAVLAAACALEMVHTYSLIHDDLPAIDDDELRRGRATCHVQFDEATAILTGDALQTEAFRLLAEHAPDADAGRAMVLELALAAGTRGMVGGEIADIEAEGKAPDLALVERIHLKKTAALFRASAVLGGLAAGAPEPVLQGLRGYGTALGLAFQIVDDVLDETSDAATLGKSAGKDRAAHKMSYPAAAGIEASRQRARACADEARRALAVLPGATMLAALADFAVTRTLLRSWRRSSSPRTCGGCRAPISRRSAPISGSSSSTR